MKGQKWVIKWSVLLSIAITVPFLVAPTQIPMTASQAPESDEVLWQLSGPGGGGWIQSIAFDPKDPNTLYVGCDVGGFYISTDWGKRFEIRNKGLRDYFVECIAVHPKDTDIILLGTLGGIFRTTNKGKTWQRMDKEFPPIQRYSYSSPIGAICFDPQNPNVAYAGIGRPRWSREGRSGEGQGAIYRSDDAGITWRRIDGGQIPKDAVVSDIEVKPDDSKVILVATDKGVFRSDDGGKTWQLSVSGLPHLFTQELAFAPSQPNRVYLTLLTTARGNEAWNGGIYRSDDAGRTWRPCDGGIPKLVGRSLYQQSNYGEIVVDPRNADVVYVGGRSWWSTGIYKTVDGGRSWNWVSRREPNGNIVDYGWITFWGLPVECLAISPVNPDRLAFGTSGHVFVTEDGGKSWQQRYCEILPDGRFRGNGLEVTCVNDIVPDPKRSNRVYFCYSDIGLLISDDNGQTFRRSFEGMKGGGNCFTLVVDPQAPDTIWAATGEWAWNEGYLCRSDDGGKTWRVVGEPKTGLPNGQVRHIVLDLRSPVRRRRLIVTVEGHGFYESRDGGLTWQSINGNLPPEATKHPGALVLNPLNSQHLIIGCAGAPENGAGIYETRDGGKTWTLLNSEPIFLNLRHLVADPRNFRTLYLAARGVFKSTDGGRTWARVLDFRFVSSVAISPANNNIIYAATTDYPYHDDCVAEGVLKSSDGGKTWRKVNTGLSHWNVSCIAINPHDPSQLYIGVAGNSAFVGIDRQVKELLKSRSRR